MPDKPLTVAAYAAGASLAAITVFYVFGPTFFIDGENSVNTASGRKRGIIGLSNPANDCFINSVLQALAGLGDLRLYLIRELHRRELDGPEVYETVAEEGDDAKNMHGADKTRELQQGIVTRSFKGMLDALNERPIYQKTISARPFIETLERAFKTRISRSQQDAQEFLQILAERLCDEHHAALKARKRALPSLNLKDATEGANGSLANGDDPEQQHPSSSSTTAGKDADAVVATPSAEYLGFPFEGKLESQIQCQTCRFRNKASSSDFVTLTLNVPQKTSTTLDHCFDILLKTEDIDDFKCDKCRLEHALETKVLELTSIGPGKNAMDIRHDIKEIEKALKEDPEKLPDGVELPPLERAPKRRIKRYMSITSFPKLLAIHLSRSIFDPGSMSFKNAAKVSFPERLRLGGILDEKWYKLLGIVCHKGNHNSGHYESFRRNHVYPPFATPDVFSAYSVQSKNSSQVTSRQPSPTIAASARASDVEPRPSTVSARSPAVPSTPVPSASLSPPPESRSPSKQGVEGERGTVSGVSGVDGIVGSDPFKLLSRYRSHKSEASRPRSNHSNCKSDAGESSKFGRKKKSQDRWWRISDDKIKECKTSDVLSMQREVYLLFYELERPGDDFT